MYVSTSPRAQLFANLGRLGATIARGVSAAAAARRAQQDQAAGLDEIVEGKDPASCTPCAEEEARLRAAAEAWADGNL